MNRIEQAQKEGCMHCFKKELTLVSDKKLICNSCGCIHTPDGYQYSVPINSFEREKEAHWGTYNEQAVENEVALRPSSGGSSILNK